MGKPRTADAALEHEIRSLERGVERASKERNAAYVAEADARKRREEADIRRRALEEQIAARKQALALLTASEGDVPAVPAVEDAAEAIAQADAAPRAEPVVHSDPKATALIRKMTAKARGEDDEDEDEDGEAVLATGQGARTEPRR
jgi:hypothetical protein